MKIYGPVGIIQWAGLKGIREAKMHFYRISDSLKNTLSVAVDLQNEFYIINACIIYQFVL